MIQFTDFTKKQINWFISIHSLVLYSAACYLVITGALLSIAINIMIRSRLFDESEAYSMVSARGINPHTIGNVYWQKCQHDSLLLTEPFLESWFISVYTINLLIFPSKFFSKLPNLLISWCIIFAIKKKCFGFAYLHPHTQLSLSKHDTYWIKVRVIDSDLRGLCHSCYDAYLGLWFSDMQSYLSWFCIILKGY